MVQKKYKPTTPSKRFFTNILFIDNTKLIKRNLTPFLRNKHSNANTNRNKINSSVRKIKNKVRLNYLTTFFKFTSYVSISFLYDRCNKKEFCSFQNIYNSYIVYPSLDTIYIGLKLNFFAFNLKKTAKNCLSTIVTLSEVPSSFMLTYLMNNSNTKFTFSLSSGCYIQKLKSKKYSKLATLLLPSKVSKKISFNTKCIFGVLSNIFLKTFVYGKYGSVWKKKYLTQVRGVAKNPVDHPNGGRTKSKSPELSPWGWIAKHNN